MIIALTREMYADFCKVTALVKGNHSFNDVVKMLKSRKACSYIIGEFSSASSLKAEMKAIVKNGKENEWDDFLLYTFIDGELDDIRLDPRYIPVIL